MLQIIFQALRLDHFAKIPELEQPPVEDGGEHDLDPEREMLIAIGDHCDVLSEAVNYGADDEIIEAKLDIYFLSAEHAKYFF